MSDDEQTNAEIDAALNDEGHYHGAGMKQRCMLCKVSKMLSVPMTRNIPHTPSHIETAT